MIIIYITLGMILFILGVLGILLNRKNLIVMLMAIELMLLAINVNYIVYSILLDDIIGQIFSLYILTVAAAESAIGLAILVAYYRVKGTIAIMYINMMKG